MPLKYPDKPIVIHFYDRRDLQGSEQNHIPGGATVYYMPSQGKMAFSVCNTNDNFNCDRGRLIAQNRASFNKTRSRSQSHRFNRTVDLPASTVNSWADVRDAAIQHLQRVAVAVGNANLSNVLQLEREEPLVDLARD